MLRSRSVGLIAGAFVVVAVSAAVIAVGGSRGGAPATASPGLVSLASSGGRTASSSSTVQASFGPNVGQGVYQGVSPAVSSLPAVPVPTSSSIAPREIENIRPQATPQNVTDPLVQTRAGTLANSTPATLASFDGICLPFGPPCAQPSRCVCLPPDTNGEAGATQYVETVNTDFAVYSKSGAVLRRSTPINQLWAKTSGECKRHNDGDPVVVYDQLAGRWLISEFIARPDAGESYGECIAVSRTSDATGSYYLYEFLFGTVSPGVFHDYPKIGVWPDGYYMSTNEFPDGQATSSGAGAFVFERSKMLNGKPARFVFFDESAHNPVGGQYIGQLPGDLDGATRPPAGTPNYFAEVDDPASVPPTKTTDTGFDLRLWNFHVDWSNPKSSTFGVKGAPNFTLKVAPFVRPQCVYGYGPNCVPQKNGAQDLDTLGDRLMFRMPYRQFADHASLLLNHTVVGDGRTGIRWYEVRIPTVGGPRIYQQGTYAPGSATTDPIWRWMGSIAMDRAGNIALGYSASGPNDFPSIRYTGHRAGTTPGLMTQAEANAFTGTGPQTEVEGRWGDYSDLSVDPQNDCTFWYAQEYLAEDFVLVGTWRTRIVAFKLPGCT